MKAAIYHFTDGSQKRPAIYQKQLKELEEYANFLGCTEVEVFCDLSLLKIEQSEFNRLLSCIDEFDILIVKNFYHISKNTMKCMKIMQDLKEKGVKVYSLENGCFCWDEAPFYEPLRAATYCCRFGTIDEMKQIIPVQNDILKLFVAKKTNWTIVDQYFDESRFQNDGEQVNLMKLLENKEKYGILLVHSFNDIHWRTANFCKIREQLQLNIFSLQEGFLKYNKRIQR